MSSNNALYGPQVYPWCSSRTVKALPATFYHKFFSTAAQQRKPSPIRSLFPLESRPGLISLLAGKPNPETFPFTSLSFSARCPTDSTNESKELSLSLSDAELAEGLQYGGTGGSPAFCDWVFGLQECVHGRRRDEGWSVTIGNGSQDLIYKAVAATVNPGDSVLVESPAYAGVIPMFENLHCNQIEVSTDDQGINAEALQSILENWPAAKPKPKVLYTVPYGCNPTGTTATRSRRKQVLALAKVHDFLILEDDPYYYLYYGDSPRPPSYFSLELEEAEVGRVLRFDSLSKILSAGIRIGFASGPASLLEAIDRHTATSSLQVSGITQAVVLKLLVAWGYDGFKTHTENVSSFYAHKRDIFDLAMRKHLTGLAEWTRPEAGMFIWFKLLLTDPTSADAEEGDSKSVIETQALARGVLALPGTVFLPNGRKTAYVRASFSLTPEADVEEAVKRIRQTILDARSA